MHLVQVMSPPVKPKQTDQHTSGPEAILQPRVEGEAPEVFTLGRPCRPASLETLLQASALPLLRVLHFEHAQQQRTHVCARACTFGFSAPESAQGNSAPESAQGKGNLF